MERVTNSQKFARMLDTARDMFAMKNWDEMNKLLVDLMVDMALTTRVENLRMMADSFDKLGPLFDQSEDCPSDKWRDVLHAFFALASRSDFRGLEEHERRRIERMLELGGTMKNKCIRS